MTESNDFLLDNFPNVRNQRTVYFDNLSEEDEFVLTNRGYNVVRIHTLPRDTHDQNVQYLLAKAQGMEEGTIACSPIQFRILELEMKAANMLVQNKTNTNVQVKVDKDDVNELLNWSKSRHTLRGNTTVVDVEEK